MNAIIFIIVGWILISVLLAVGIEWLSSFWDRNGPIGRLRTSISNLLDYREEAIKDLEQLFERTVGEQYAWAGADSTPLDRALGQTDSLLAYIHNLRVELDVVGMDSDEENERQALLALKTRVRDIPRRKLTGQCHRLRRTITSELKRYTKQTAKKSGEQSIQPPPKLAERLLYYATPRRMRLAVLGDLEEEYREIYRRFGERDALLWYRWQAAKSIGLFILRLIIKLRSIGWLVDIFRRFI